jgi:hypothetical protein
MVDLVRMQIQQYSNTVVRYSQYLGLSIFRAYQQQDTTCREDDVLSF